MNFAQFLTILKARKKIALFAFFITVGTTLLVTLLLPKTYEASSSLVVNYTGTDPITGNRLPAQLMPGYMATQVDIINSRKVGLKVVEQLGLYTNPSYVEAFYESTEGKGDIQNWIADLILKDLTVIPSRDSNVIILNYESADPKLAAVLVNTFSEAYIESNLELKIEPSKRTADWFRGQIKEFRENLMVAQRALSDYQREKGIISIDERLDVENTRLSQLSQQLVLAQSDLSSLESKRDAINESNLEGSSSDLASDPIIRDIKVSLAKAEIRLDELQQRLSTKHPEYIAAKSEVDSLKRKFRQELVLAIERINSNVAVAQQRVNEVEDLLERQKLVLLEINDNRNMLDVLTRDVEDSKQVLSVMTQRLSQTALEGNSSESDISILNPAVEPVKPTKPNLTINLILSIFLGSILAITIALFSELSNRRIRSADDVNLVLDLPLLGEIENVK